VLRGSGLPITVKPCDLRVRVRKVRAPTLTVLMLDSSGSMAALKRISVAKGVALKIVEEAYIRRSPVSLIVFRGEKADVVVPPTRNYQVLLSTLEKVPTGGRTPLSSALKELLRLSRLVKMKCKQLKVKAILITDGKANVPLGRGSIESEIVKLAREIKRLGVKLTIYDTRPFFTLDPAPSYIGVLEEEAGARVYRV